MSEAEELDLTASTDVEEINKDSEVAIAGESSIEEQIEAIELSDELDLPNDTVDLSEDDTTVDLSDAHSDESKIADETAVTEENDDAAPELETAAAAPRRRRWGRNRKG